MEPRNTEMLRRMPNVGALLWKMICTICLTSRGVLAVGTFPFSSTFRGGSSAAASNRRQQRGINPPLSERLSASVIVEQRRELLASQPGIQGQENRPQSTGGHPTKSSSSQAATLPILSQYAADTKLPTDVGEFRLRAYRVPGRNIGLEPCVIYAADKPPFGKDGKLRQGVPVRIHDQCLTSEVFRSQRCDCKEQLNMALKYVQQHGGAIIYLQQEGRGIGLANKVAAYALQDEGFDTVDANLHLGLPEDNREYGIVRDILDEMQISSIQLMTNNPRKVRKLISLGISVDGTIPMVVPQANQHNYRYMATKVSRMNHDNLDALLEKGPSTPSLNKSIPENHFMTSRR